jgi:hypothetical protein
MMSRPERRRKKHVTNTMNRKSRRFVLIAATVLLFSGLVLYSVLQVRFPVKGGEKSEFDVIEYSLTDSIQRGQDGVFTLTSAQETGGKGEPDGAQPKPCPT